ncbi:glutamine amidotransferase [Actinotignum urinale]|uniref:Glutamine amidotransferase n=1 Tax=Actinotignum urinale TaxID=190146 RepID=A0ABU5G8V1_9ACTO|nr:glutamine amidotransferase [Actinotignum urinale]MDY5132491.1 glutamine amidotransferase [Actinotignum urinale]
MSKILLAGESWVSDVVDHKGFDHFPHTQVHIGCAELLSALRNAGHEVTHMRSHDVAVIFPYTIEELNEYDVLILSDIGANTLLLPPQVFEEGKRVPNRLMTIRDWVRSGGGLMMAGGYLSFQGFQAMANYAGTPIEDVLPVRISRWDDRVEAPQGVQGKLTPATHPVTAGLDATWPHLLGYQKLVADVDGQVLAEVNGDPLLVVAEYGRGRSVAFASDISPHWAPQEFMSWSGYQVLFDNIVRWLAKDVA